MWGAEAATVTFGPTRALDDVTLALPRGEVTAVVGGDGAGKTTLLRALLRRVPLTTGTLDVPDVAQVGYQPSTSGVWPNLSVAENVAFVGRAYGMGAAALAGRADALLDAAGLTDARDRLGSRLSGGMRQKLGFCLAMLHDPVLLLLDEPSTGVDPVSRVELWRLVTRAAAAGAAVAMTTTYLDEAERAATVVALDSGRVLASGTPDDVVASVPGTVTTSGTRPPGDPDRTWRRGTAFRRWTPEGDPTPAGDPADVDLEDALVALTIARADAGATA